ncbi:MAG: DUF2336 domain-containing protein [Maricaulaceae bacterium]|nr:DUF2336 domain-containing protein [Maricaulaceae bacterium]
MSVIAMRNRLTEADIQRLVKGADVEERAMAARKICHRIDRPDLTPAEREAANAIVAMIAQDAVALVRRALAVTMRQSPHLPREIAVHLAKDIDSIAIPVIAGTPVLTDDDLIEIVRGGEGAKQAAVAARPEVSTPVVNAIMDHGDEQACGVAAANDGARFDDQAYQKAFVRFCESRTVMDAFVARSTLPINITEKLIAHVSDAALERLVRRHALPPQLAVELAEGSRERAVVDLVDQAGVAPDMRRFVQQLQLNGRLTPSLILRAIFRGHISFFEHAAAELAGLPHAKAWLLIHDAGPLGLKAIFDRTGMPPRIFPAIRAALEVAHSLEIGDSEQGRAEFRRRLAERALTRFQGLPEEDMEYILARMDEEQSGTYQPAARIAVG